MLYENFNLLKADLLKYLSTNKVAIASAKSTDESYIGWACLDMVTGKPTAFLISKDADLPKWVISFEERYDFCKKIQSNKTEILCNNCLDFCKQDCFVI